MILNIPLMHNNITEEDRNALIEFLRQDATLTQSAKVQEFEEQWSRWLGVKYSVFVNSGASANVLTMAVLKELYGGGEVIVPPLTWVSDIASVMHAGLTPVFADISPTTLGMATEEIFRKLTPKTRAVFLTHVLGFNALTDRLLEELRERGVVLIEDVCESHGASFHGKKLGTFGFASNFSYYYAHHMSTIEGGMICTNDETFYQYCRMGRSHGMVREATSQALRDRFAAENPQLHPEFIFAFPAYNMRSTELNAVIGLNQLKRLDKNNEKRQRNLRLFLENLNPARFRTDFDSEGSVNYAFVVVLRERDTRLRDAIAVALRDARVEFRRGLSGGGNQMRQPFCQRASSLPPLSDFPQVEHVHTYGFYIGNYPNLAEEKILALCRLLNSVEV